MILIGLRAPFDFVPEAALIGYDYLELPLNRVASLTDREFLELQDYAVQARFRVYAMYDMLPEEMRVNGQNVRATQQHEYLQRAFSRAHALGASIVAFDAAASRNVPAGTDFDLARRQTGNFLRIAQGHAKEYGLKIAIQNIRFSSCNLINTVSEAALMAALLQLSQVGVLADTVQMAYQSESFAAIDQCGATLAHVATGCALKRSLPYPGDGEDYTRLFRMLQRRGYSGGVTAVTEGACTPTEAATALKVLRSAMIP